MISNEDKSDSKAYVIIGHKISQRKYMKDLVNYRELFYFFAWRDILVRYKQAFFGAAWALFRPLLNMLIFTLIFGKIAHLPSDNVNYSLFVLAGMLPWQLFSNAAIDTCNGLVNQANLVSKVYFPRLIIPASQIGVHLLDFAIATIMLFVLLPFFEVSVGYSLLALPCFLLLVLMLSLGTGLFLSALTVKYRDFRILVPFFIQFGMFLSPVGYGSFLISEKWALLYALNPLVGIIDGFRWSLFGITHPFLGINVAFSALTSFVVLITGYFYFRKTETTFADNI